MDELVSLSRPDNMYNSATPNTNLPGLPVVNDIPTIETQNQTNFLQNLLNNTNGQSQPEVDPELGPMREEQIIVQTPSSPPQANEPVSSEVQTQGLSRPYFSRTNDLYGKMNCFVLLNMLEVLILAITCLGILYSEPVNFFNLKYYLVVDLAIEAFGVYLFHKYSTINQYGTSKKVLIPLVTKFIVTLCFFLDVQSGSRILPYFSPLLLVPSLMGGLKKTGYDQLKVHPVCLSLFISVSQILLIVRGFTNLNLLYYSAFIILFYCFLLNIFFGLVSFLVSVFTIIKAAFTCFKKFEWRICAVQMILTLDNAAAAFVALIAANWSYIIDLQNKAENHEGE